MNEKIKIKIDLIWIHIEMALNASIFHVRETAGEMNVFRSLMCIQRQRNTFLHSTTHTHTRPTFT